MIYEDKVLTSFINETEPEVPSEEEPKTEEEEEEEIE